MGFLKLAKSQEESKLSELDKIIKLIESKTNEQKAPLLSELNSSKARLNEINSELKRQKINKDILKEIIDMREESSSGLAISGGVPVAPDAEGMPLLDQLANRR